ncbi:hypothetical protein Droror1_Dr00017780 [Drosera rotundifolia]
MRCPAWWSEERRCCLVAEGGAERQWPREEKGDAAAKRRRRPLLRRTRMMKGIVPCSKDNQDALGDMSKTVNENVQGDAEKVFENIEKAPKIGNAENEVDDEESETDYDVPLIIKMSKKAAEKK